MLRNRRLPGLPAPENGREDTIWLFHPRLRPKRFLQPPANLVDAPFLSQASFGLLLIFKPRVILGESSRTGSGRGWVQRGAGGQCHPHPDLPASGTCSRRVLPSRGLGVRYDL